MNVIKNENQLTIVKEYEFDTSPIRKMDSIVVICIRDCHNKYFHTVGYKCVYDIKFTNIGKNQLVKLKLADKRMKMYELKEILKFASRKGFIFNQKSILKL